MTLFKDSRFYFWGFIIALWGFSIFFVFKVERFRASLKTITAPSVKSGDIIILTKVIDGDELIAKHQEASIVVRLLGIQSFKAKLTDPFLQAYGKQAINFVSQYLNQKARITFDPASKKQDKRKRYIAHLLIEEKDIGLEMVRRGLVIVYSKYPFTAFDKYSAAEQKARNEKVGLWGDPKVVLRVETFKAIWESK